MVQWVKDPSLPQQQWCRFQLWLGIDPCPGNFHMPWVGAPPKKKLTKEVKDLHNENCNMLLKDIKEEINKWKQFPRQWIRRLNIV